MDRRAGLLAAAFFLGAAAPHAPVQASPPAEFDKVEEDWELVIARPDPVKVGPQVTTSMAPSAGEGSPLVTFNLNYRERPNFLPGGMQVQFWTADGEIGETASHDSALFNTENETLSWTQRLRLSGGSILYEIENGTSTTWGKFGQSERLTVSLPATVNSLSGYDPARSATRSGVTWQSNYVTRLVLKRVRYYANGSLVSTDETPRTVVENVDQEAD